jgi:Copper transport outer membrane protein, MctB
VIDFRYHLVSIIAVFLALAVGLVVGSTALSGKAEEALTAAQHKAISDNAALHKDKELLQQEVLANQAFATASSQRLLAGLLTGERVVLIAAPGADGSVLSGLNTALRQAGATVTGQVSLTTLFTTTTGQNEAALNELAQNLAGNAGLVLSADPASPVAGQQAAAQMLAASLLSKSASLTNSASEHILAGLDQYGFISVDSGTPQDAPAELAILVTPDGQPSSTVNQVLVAVTQELKSADSATVMAGALVAIGADSTISAENAAGPVVSTVDYADTEIGQILVVWALRAALDGKLPAVYGAGSPDAPSLPPTPLSTPTVRSSTTSTAKSHG